MSLWTYFTGAPSQEEQDAQLAARRAAFAADVQQRRAAELITQDQASKATDFLNNIGQNENQYSGAAVGALQGATEIFYDPAMYVKDVSTGAQIVGQAASDAADAAKQQADKLLWAGVKKFFKDVPWIVWIALAVAAFVWLGGIPLLLHATKGRLAR